MIEVSNINKTYENGYEALKLDGEVQIKVALNLN